MRRPFTFLVIAAVVGLLTIAPASAGTILLLGGDGFGYEQPDIDPALLAIGDGFEAVGVFDEAGPWSAPFVHFDTHEYTFRVSGPIVTERTFDAPSQILIVEFEGEASVQVFADSRVGGTAASYGVNPPNATVPSSFIDGELVVGGRMDKFRLYFDLQFEAGEFLGEVLLTEGTLPDPAFVPYSRDWWWFRGYLARPDAGIPAGYWQGIWDGGLMNPAPLATERSSWGAIKRTYR